VEPFNIITSITLSGDTIWQFLAFLVLL